MTLLGLTSYESLAEIVWLLGIIIFALIIFIGKNGKRGFILNLGAMILVVSYSGLLNESLLSFSEISILHWLVRLGISFTLFDLAKRTDLINVSQAFKKLGRRFYDRKHKG